MKLATLIMAAGFGKRMNSDIPKVLHLVHSKPMVNYCIELGKRLGSTKLILIVGYKKEIVIKATQGYNVEYAVQEPQLGTGHAVMSAEESLDGFEGDILVLSGDVPLLRDETIIELLKTHRENNAVATVLTAKASNPFNYGRVVRDSEGFVVKIVEEKDATEEERKINEINSGIYVFNKTKLFEALHLIKSSPVTNEYYLTTVFDLYTENHQKVCAVIADNADEILGVNTAEQLQKIESLVQKN